MGDDGVAAPVIAGLAIGTGFIVLFAVFAPPLQDYSTQRVFGGLNDYHNRMPASYYLNTCNLPSDTQLGATDKAIKDRNWISVVKVDRALGYVPRIDVPCTIVTSELASEITALSKAIGGAEGCITGTEVCGVSYGMSVGGDDANYELTITKAEAANILQDVKLGEHNSALLAKADSFYIMHFYSYGNDEVSGGAQVEAQFSEPGPSYEPILLAAGESISYPLLVKTWATYGGPAKIDLLALPSARDSGLVAEFEPASLEIGERTEAKATLKITATSNVRSGIYDISVGGRINDQGYFPIRNCDFSCITIKNGDSNFHISTFGSDMSIGQYGPGKIPSWLSLEVHTDKDVYSVGEQIEIGAYLVNGSPEKVVLDGKDSNIRLVLMIYGPTSAETSSSVYGIDAFDFDLLNPPITIEPESKYLLVRTFVWDQKTFSSGVEPHQVFGGEYTVSASFAGFGNAVLGDSYQIMASRSGSIETP